MFVQMILVWGDIVQMAQCLFLLSTDIGMFTKFLSLRGGNSTVRDIFKNLVQDSFIPRNEAEMMIMKKIAGPAIFIRNAYAFCSLFCLVLVCVYPISVGKWELPLPSYYPVNLEDNRNVFNVFLHVRIQNVQILHLLNYSGKRKVCGQLIIVYACWFIVINHTNV